MQSARWFYSLGENYGVNPLIFGAIYVGAIPFFSLSIAWLVKNYRQKKSIVLPALSAMFFFISAYIYLIFAGKNVPVWVYAICHFTDRFRRVFDDQKSQKTDKSKAKFYD